MLEMPRISVIMPAYNAEAYIGEAIDSILAQTFSDFELLVIDDGSSDSTPEIIESYSDPRVRLVRNPHNMGVARTLNHGLDLAVGEYIARMDADDIALPERFARQVAFMDAHPEVAVCACAISFFGASRGTRFFSTLPGQLKVDLLFGNCFAHPTVMLRAALFGREGYRYDPSFSRMEDFDLWCRVAEKHALAAIPEILLSYRIHPNQITQNPTPENTEQRRAIAERHLAQLGLADDAGAETFIASCLGRLPHDEESLFALRAFFGRLQKNNRALGIYAPAALRLTLNAVLNGRMAKLPIRRAALIAPKIGGDAVLSTARRALRTLREKNRADREIKKNRRKLKNRRFTIISNNCWGGMIYQKYGLKYRTPTVGLYILGRDFVKLAADWKHYFAAPLQFIPWEEASYYPFLRDKEPYPVARLDDIEIYFMHYRTAEEAAEKWARRVGRIDPEHMIFKLSQRENCSADDVRAFMALPGRKICFAYDDIPGTVHIPELRGLRGDEMPVVSRYFDELTILNES